MKKIFKEKMTPRERFIQISVILLFWAFAAAVVAGVVWFCFWLARNDIKTTVKDITRDYYNLDFFGALSIKIERETDLSDFIVSFKKDGRIAVSRVELISDKKLDAVLEAVFSYDNQNYRIMAEPLYLDDYPDYSVDDLVADVARTIAVISP